MGLSNLKYHKTKSFKIFYKKLKRSLKKKESKVKNEQIKNLKKVLIYSYNNIPFYKKLFDQIKLNPFHFNKLNLINKIPTINKKTILENYKDFENNSIKENKKIFMTTGGSTGNPLLIPMTKEYKSRSLACTFFYTNYLGFSIFKDRSVRLHGDLILKNKIYKISKNKLILSLEKINIKNIYKITSVINKFHPKYVHAYPSAIFLLCRLLLKKKIILKVKINAVFTDSEVLYDYQKKEIEKYFKCKVFNTYGHTEGAVLGISTTSTEFIHIQPDVGILQLIDKESHKEIKKNNISGEIVVTGFINDAFPLIRYKTGDIASYAYVPKSKNIFNYKILKKIEGREQDYIISKRKELIPAAPLLFDYNINWSGIEKFQIKQKKIGEIKLLLKILNDNEKNIILKRIKKQFSKLFNNSIKTKYKIVKNIENTRIGKFRYMNQFLNIDKYK